MQNDPKITAAAAETVLRSKEARQLMEILRKDGGEALANAAKAAKAGDHEKAAQILKPLLNDPNAENLMGQLSRQLGRP